MPIKLSRRSLLGAGLGLSSIAAASLALPATAQAETVLQFNRWLPAAHFVSTRVHDVWAEDIGKATEGRVKVQMTASSLGPPPRQFDLARDGVADIVWGVHGYTPERFSVSPGLELPFLSNSAEALSIAYWRAHKKHFEKLDEHAGVKLLALHVHPPGDIFSNTKPLRTLADLRGMKLRILNPATAQITEKLGAVPVSAPASKAYELLSRGVIDGTFFSSDSILGFKLDKHINHQMQFEGGLYNASFFVAMNQRRWDSLDKRDQEAIEALSGEAFAKRIGSVWDEENHKAQKTLIDRGLTVTKVEGALLDEVRELLGDVEEAWVKTMDDKGVDGTAALKMIRDEAAAHEAK